MNTKHEINNTMLNAKIESRDLEEITNKHQTMIQSYKDEMKKYDLKISECAYKAENADKTVEKLVGQMVTKDELNPRIVKLERDFKTILVKYK